MKILILTASDPYKTAGIVALDLYRALKNNNDEVKILVKKWGKYDNKDIIPLESSFRSRKNKIILKIRNRLLRLGIIKDSTPKTNTDYSVLNYDQTETYYSTEKILNKAGFNPDRIIVLFMHNFLSYKNLNEIYHYTKVPIYLYLMDMAPMTGGCHYAWSCDGYLKECGNCPAIYSKTIDDQTHINWKYKYKNVENIDLKVIAGTSWTYNQLLKSSIFRNKEKYKILISVDNDVFKSEDKNLARKRLGLPNSKKIIFFGAVSASNKRKGFMELIQALNILKNQNLDYDIHLIIAGNADNHLIKNLPFEYSLLGKLNHLNLSAAFQAADIFVSPSIEDSGPMMINQSIMCGTPVVAFEMGVAVDLVITGETGYRAKLKDSVDFSHGINFLLSLSESEYIEMRTKCRKLGMELYNHRAQAEKFMEILRSL